MLLGALLDAGAPLDDRAGRGRRGRHRAGHAAPPSRRCAAGCAATHVQVRTAETAVVRTWANVRGLLEDAAARRAGPRARAWTSSPGWPGPRRRPTARRPDQVHFHEVGALDAIADVVGAAAALHALGVTDAAASPVAVGQGMVRAAHGLLPVPTPAVRRAAAEAGAPVHSGDEPYELCTPTGAALLAATVPAVGRPAARAASSGPAPGRAPASSASRRTSCGSCCSTPSPRPATTRARTGSRVRRAGDQRRRPRPAAVARRARAAARGRRGRTPG